MAYQVSITSRAERDFASLFDEIDAHNSKAALKWYKGLKKVVLSLEELPECCPVTPEDSRLRDLLYGRKPHVYRVIYRVLKKENVVEILHIRHGAMRPFQSSNLS